jgi:hypothetical protein
MRRDRLRGQAFLIVVFEIIGINWITLLDANAVLNAALLPKSFAVRAVVLAKQLGHCRFLVSA